MSFGSVAELEARLAEPSQRLVADMGRVAGDVMLLGAGGKMGPSLALLARNALAAAGNDARVIAVSRFSDAAAAAELEAAGVEVVRADLLDEAQLAALPDAPNVIYMAAMKFACRTSPTAGVSSTSRLANCSDRVKSCTRPGTGVPRTLPGM